MQEPECDANSVWNVGGEDGKGRKRGFGAVSADRSRYRQSADISPTHPLTTSARSRDSASAASLRVTESRNIFDYLDEGRGHGTGLAYFHAK